MTKASRITKRKKLAKRPGRRLSLETPVTRTVSDQPSDANKNKDTINHPPRSEKMKETGKVAVEKKFPKTGIMVSGAELEDFFSAAEKTIEQQFAEKYNFDFVNEVPLEGRYEWVKMTPSP